MSKSKKTKKQNIPDNKPVATTEMLPPIEVENKKLYTLISMLQIMMVLTCYIIEYYARNKMGVMRHVLYINQKWQSMYNVRLIELIINVMLVFVSWTITTVQKNTINRNIKLGLGNSLLLELTAVFCSYLLYAAFFRVENLTSYYFVGMVLLGIVVIEILKYLYYLNQARKKLSTGKSINKK